MNFGDLNGKGGVMHRNFLESRRAGKVFAEGHGMWSRGEDPNRDLVLASPIGVRRFTVSGFAESKDSTLW
jgi:hypothetical protein